MSVLRFNRLRIFRQTPGDSAVPDIPLPLEVETCLQRAADALIRHSEDPKVLWHLRPYQARLMGSAGEVIASFRIIDDGTVETTLHDQQAAENAACSLPPQFSAEMSDALL